jgi:hypothetical protein
MVDDPVSGAICVGRRGPKVLSVDRECSGDRLCPDLGRVGPRSGRITRHSENGLDLDAAKDHFPDTGFASMSAGTKTTSSSGLRVPLGSTSCVFLTAKIRIAAGRRVTQAQSSQI